MNGKNFVSVRPKKYIVVKKKNEVASKSKFTVVVKFCSYVNSIPQLHEVWKHANLPETNAYTRLIKQNNHFVSPDNPTTSNIITPASDIHFISDIEFSDSEIILFLDNSFSTIKNKIKASTLVCFFCFCQPKNKKSPAFSFYHTIQKFESVNRTENNRIIVRITPEINKMGKGYQKLICYASILFSKKDKNHLSASSTFSKTFSLL